ncbi:MAG: serine/threonine protein kinase, partial [Waterburya sp.]
SREIELLKTLDHPNIPRFIDSFETENGACLVQEYIDAPNLDQKRTYTLEEIKKITKDLLEILVYLQSLTPPVLHRDIKPGNLLLDTENNLYLVDFGFSRIGLDDIAVSSMVRGTTGFMPPEQMLGINLTKASDLYSVGATIACLMMGMPSGKLAQLIDVRNNRLKFKGRIDCNDSLFLEWLERMLEPRACDRFADATKALEQLKYQSVLFLSNNDNYVHVKRKDNTIPKPTSFENILVNIIPALVYMFPVLFPIGIGAFLCLVYPPIRPWESKYIRTPEQIQQSECLAIKNNSLFCPK